MTQVKIGNVMEFPPNIFWSDNRPNIGALVAGRDVAEPGPPDKANRWYRVGFNPGAGYDDVGTDRARVLEGGGRDPGNGGTLQGWQPIIARNTAFVRKNIPAIVGATVDGVGDVYIEDNKALAATLNGRYGSYVPDTGLSPLGGGALPPGPASYAGGSTSTDTAIEFSVIDDGGAFWTAKTPQVSAKKTDNNPHPGISVINPGQWDQVAGGMSVDEALSLDDYKQKGWTGLGRKFLAWQGEGVVQPAGEELASAMDSAADGDAGALRALRSVGIRNKSIEGGATDEHRGLFGSLGFKF